MASKYTYIRPSADEKNVLGVIVYEKDDFTDDDPEFIGEYLFKDKECTEPILKDEMTKLLDKFKIIVQRSDGTQYSLFSISDVINTLDENGDELPEEEWTIVEDQYFHETENEYLIRKLNEFGLFDAFQGQPSTYTAVIDDGNIVFDDPDGLGYAFLDAERFLNGEGPCPTLLLRSASDNRFSDMRPVSLAYGDTSISGNGRFDYIRFLGYYHINRANSDTMFPSHFDIIRERTSDESSSYMASDLHEVYYVIPENPEPLGDL